MTLYLDSALAEDARRAAALGFVRGATTNPHLIAAAGVPATEAVAALCDILPGTVFHQLAGADPAARAVEALAMLALRPGRVGLKIPCTLDGLALAAELSAEGHVVGITAVFDAAQVALACEAGAHYVLPYVNRSTRLMGDGPGMVRRMRAVADALDAPLQIIAASVKTPHEAVATLLAGAHHLTLPLAVIEAMARHPLSAAAIEDFRSAATAAG